MGIDMALGLRHSPLYAPAFRKCEGPTAIHSPLPKDKGQAISAKKNALPKQ
jgi:hypothetical protein